VPRLLDYHSLGDGNMGFVYKISNTENDKIYVGVTTKSIENRWRKHKTAHYKTNTEFYNDMRLYGLDKYTFKQVSGAIRHAAKKIILNTIIIG